MSRAFRIAPAVGLAAAVLTFGAVLVGTGGPAHTLHAGDAVPVQASATAAPAVSASPSSNDGFSWG